MKIPEGLLKNFTDLQQFRKKRSYRSLSPILSVQAQQALANWEPLQFVTRNDGAIYQVLDLFCGCGGMSSGFLSVSKVIPFFRIIGGIDLDPNAASTFQSNFGVGCLVKDLSTVNPNVGSANELLRSMDGYDPKTPLVLIGCAPCQGFTSHRKKKWNKNDKRNNLVEVFARLAVLIKPDCIVMENVPELLSQKYWKYFEIFRSVLQSSGYKVQASIYNAATFNVPQERFRSLVIAMKKQFTLPGPISDSQDFITVRDAIGLLPAVKAGQSHPSDNMHRSARHKAETLSTIRAIPKNGGSRPYGVGPKCLDEVKGFYDVYGRLHWDKPAITLTHYARNPASGRFVHPEQNRGLTMREAALLQSFPNGYVFKGGFDSVFKQIGEAVPPKFACAIASHVLAELISDEPSVEETKFATPSIISPVSNSYSSVIAGIKMSRIKHGLPLR